MSESELLSFYRNKFKDIYLLDKKEYLYTFDAIEIQLDRPVFLKVYDKKLIEDGPKDFFLNQIKREEELTKLCKCENVIELYYKLKTDISIIFVYEKCEEENLENYSFGKTKENYKDYFIKIVRSIANAIKVLNDKKVIHRDIKPNNFILKKIDPQNVKDDIEDNCIIKLGDFGSSIKREENDNMQIGTLLYLPPEIMQNEDYDEKCDMWSLGMSLYKIYNNFTPYGTEKDIDFELIQDKIYSDNFIYKFTDIPTLDVLFKKLLAINPKERMSHEEFYEYVYSEEFMKPGVKYKQNIYGNIYKEIENIKASKEYQNINIEMMVQENHNEIENKEETLKTVTKVAPAFDISYKHQKEKEKNVEKNGIINILYYNEDKSHPKQLGQEIAAFEKETTGKFFFIDNESSFETIMKEINKQVTIYPSFAFNLIVTGRVYENRKDLIQDKYKKCFNHICIFCINIQKYKPLENDNKVEIVSKSKREVISKFIKKYSDEKTKIYPVYGFITYKEYQKEYFNHHLRISLYYGHESQESYLKNYEKMKNLIKEDKKEIKRNENVLVKSFQKFSLEEDVKDVNENIINEYSKNTFFGEINRWLRNITKYSNEEIAYFTSRFMYSLNKYGKDKEKYFIKNEIIYRGTRLNYSSLLEYQKAKGKEIALTAFTSMTTELNVAKKFGRTKNANEFSTLYFIKNIHNNDWISNGIDIQDISRYKSEKEVLYHPFSFYKLTDVKINIVDKTAEIYLETIGKKKILELEIQKGKTVVYNEKLSIMESKLP